MGYESHIYIAHKIGEPREKDGRRYAQIIAEFELCKICNVSYKLREYPKTDCYFLSRFCDDDILQDCYGEELTECTPAELLELIEKDVENSRDDWRGGMYWRYKLILPVLRELVELNSDNIVCLHFGH